MKYGEYTENISLLKPDKLDKVLIHDINYNSDLLDKHITNILKKIDLKASLDNPEFSGIVKIPISGTNKTGIAATLDDIGQSHNVINVIICKSQSDLPNPGEIGNIYILNYKEDNPELIWNGSKYINNVTGEDYTL